MPTKIILIFIFSIFYNHADAEIRQAPQKDSKCKPIVISLLYCQSDFQSGPSHFEQQISSLIAKIEKKHGVQVKFSIIGALPPEKNHKTKFNLKNQTYMAIMRAIADSYGYYVNVLPENQGISFVKSEKAKIDPEKYKVWLTKKIRKQLGIEFPNDEKELQKKLMDLGIFVEVILFKDDYMVVKGFSHQMKMLETLIYISAEKADLNYCRDKK